MLIAPLLESPPVEATEASAPKSSVVLSTQLQPWDRGRTDNPLVRDGVQLLPNLTRVVGRSQPIYVYYEVYEPAAGEAATPMLRTSLAFYRNDVKVFETPVVERTEIGAPDRQAALFQFELPSDTLSPWIFFWRSMMPYIRPSGRGGQPGT